MFDTAQKIKNILERRKNSLPKIKQEIERWSLLESEIETLEQSIREVVDYKHTPHESREYLNQINFSETKRDIAEVLRLLRIVEVRFSRDTINIGVSGVARVGKSTLLQSISGLKDAEIPTGKGDPVTAVRSRIFHSKSNQHATLSLHTFQSFREQILQPYLNELEILDIPQSIEDFKNQRYPQSESELKPHLQKHSNSTLLGRLLLMQRSVDSYSHLLGGGEKVVKLDELRPFIAYPLVEEDPRPYLAVRDVKIECNFPRVQVESLGIVDLPGLGEVAADAEDYHLSGLQNEVDLVVLVKRPLEGMAYWKDEDKKTANLLDKARGSIKNRRDFVFILVNSGVPDPQLCDNLKRSILNLANEQQHEKNFRVLEANVSDQIAVEKDVLNPLLEHLITRLPIMDQEVFDGAKTAYTELQSKIINSLQKFKTVFRQTRVDDVNEDFDEKAKISISNITNSLRQIVLEARARKEKNEVEDDEQEYLDRLNHLYGAIMVWVDSGFGEGQDVWTQNAISSMNSTLGAATFSDNQLNSIRVNISTMYSELDDYFQSEIDKMLEKFSDVFRRELGDLPSGANGREVLTRLREAMDETSKPCKTLGKAFEDIIALKLDFRAHLLPRIRSELDSLIPEYQDRKTGEWKRVLGAYPTNTEGAERLLKDLSSLAQKAAYDTKNALLKESAIISMVLYAAVEHFEDTFVRSKDSAVEFKRFARANKNEIWPGYFQGIEETNSHFVKLNRSVEAVFSKVKEITV